MVATSTYQLRPRTLVHGPRTLVHGPRPRKPYSGFGHQHAAVVPGRVDGRGHSRLRKSYSFVEGVVAS